MIYDSKVVLLVLAVIHVLHVLHVLQVSVERGRINHFAGTPFRGKSSSR